MQHRVPRAARGAGGGEHGGGRRRLATRPSCNFWQYKTASFNQCHIFIFISEPAAKAKFAQTNGSPSLSLSLSPSLSPSLLGQRSKEVPGPEKTMNECAWSLPLTMPDKDALKLSVV